MSESSTIFHTLLVLNVSVAAIPIITFITIYIIYYLNHESINDLYDSLFLPSPSDLIDFKVEYRIYSVLMTIETFFLISVIYIQYQVRFILANKNNKYETTKFKVLQIIYIVSSVFLLVGHQIVAVVSYNLSKFMLYFGDNLWGYASIVFLFVCDILNAYLGRSSYIISRIFSWISAFSILFNLIIRTYIFQSPTLWWTISTVFYLLARICFYVKFFLMSIDLPQYYIKLSKKIL